MTWGGIRVGTGPEEPVRRGEAMDPAVTPSWLRLQATAQQGKRAAPLRLCHGPQAVQIRPAPPPDQAGEARKSGCNAAYGIRP